VLAWHKALCLPEGEPASVHGMEYDAYYGAGLLAYAYGAIVKKDPVSAALEQRAAGLLGRHARAVGVYDYHRNSWAKAAAAYLMHTLAGPRADPLPIQQAWDALRGAAHYRWQKNLIHRDVLAFVADRATQEEKATRVCGPAWPRMFSASARRSRAAGWAPGHLVGYYCLM